MTRIQDHHSVKKTSKGLHHRKPTSAAKVKAALKALHLKSNSNIEKESTAYQTTVVTNAAVAPLETSRSNEEPYLDVVDAFCKLSF
jgi:hypothetical protein